MVRALQRHLHTLCGRLSREESTDGLPTHLRCIAAGPVTVILLVAMLLLSMAGCGLGGGSSASGLSGSWIGAVTGTLDYGYAKAPSSSLAFLQLQITGDGHAAGYTYGCDPKRHYATARDSISGTSNGATLDLTFSGMNGYAGGHGELKGQLTGGTLHLSGPFGGSDMVGNFTGQQTMSLQRGSEASFRQQRGLLASPIPS